MISKSYAHIHYVSHMTILLLFAVHILYFVRSFVSNDCAMVTFLWAMTVLWLCYDCAMVTCSIFTSVSRSWRGVVPAILTLRAGVLICCCWVACLCDDCVLLCNSYMQLRATVVQSFSSRLLALYASGVFFFHFHVECSTRCSSRSRVIVELPSRMEHQAMQA